MTITFAYLSKCASSDPHIQIAVNVNGTPRGKVVEQLSALTTEDLDRDDLEAVAKVLLQAWFRRDKRDFPTSTLAQRRARLETYEVIL